MGGYWGPWVTQPAQVLVFNPDWVRRSRWGKDLRVDATGTPDQADATRANIEAQAVTLEQQGRDELSTALAGTVDPSLLAMSAYDEDYAQPPGAGYSYDAGRYMSEAVDFNGNVYEVGFTEILHVAASQLLLQLSLDYWLTVGPGISPLTRVYLDTPTRQYEHTRVALLGWLDWTLAATSYTWAPYTPNGGATSALAPHPIPSSMTRVASMPAGDPIPGGPFWYGPDAGDQLLDAVLPLYRTPASQVALDLSRFGTTHNIRLLLTPDYQGVPEPFASTTGFPTVDYGANDTGRINDGFQHYAWTAAGSAFSPGLVRFRYQPPRYRDWVEVPEPTVEPYLRMGQRNDGLGPFRHPRLRSSRTAANSIQAGRAPRVGRTNRYR